MTVVHTYFYIAGDTQRGCHTLKLKSENKRKQTLDIGIFSESDVARNVKKHEPLILFIHFNFNAF